jgi:hypothetical protein
MSNTMELSPPPVYEWAYLVRIQDKLPTPENLTQYKKVMIRYRQAAAEYLAEEATGALHLVTKQNHVGEIRAYKLDISNEWWMNEIRCNKAPPNPRSSRS